MTAPLVSILMPAYNAEEWIAESLQSAVDQSWQRKEIIVVDDGSRDRTAEVASRFASKDVKVVSTTNQGLSAAVNHAYQLCQGDYIQELDSDDLMSPNKIERQLAALREGDASEYCFRRRGPSFTIGPSVRVSWRHHCARIYPLSNGSCGKCVRTYTCKTQLGW